MRHGADHEVAGREHEARFAIAGLYGSGEGIGASLEGLLIALGDRNALRGSRTLPRTAPYSGAVGSNMPPAAHAVCVSGSLLQR